ncbi:MAG: ECF transporter S component [Anaerolineae bacterium]|nr:ECF transporter S component [Anaerolineae bacterium]
MQRNRLDPRMLAVVAVMTAVVFVLTVVIQIPTPAKGYIHLGDTGVFFSAFAFGPWVGAIAGGLGTGLADIAAGYPQWAIFSFLIHGAQGLVAGLLYRKWPSIWGLISSAVIGGVIVVLGYLFAGMILSGVAAAVAEVPLNIIQVAAGAVVAVPLFLAVRRAYPPITRLGRPR